MRLIVLLSLVVMTFWIVGCASSAAPAPTSAPVATTAPVPPGSPSGTATSAPVATNPPAAAAPTGAPAPSAPVQAPVASSAAAAKTVQVEADDNFFRPEKITITAGTQVTWTNVGQKKHTVTYGTVFDADIKPGETFSFTFDKPGTYQYYCVTHSESDTDGMVGTITVTAP